MELLAQINPARSKATESNR